MTDEDDGRCPLLRCRPKVGKPQQQALARRLQISNGAVEDGRRIVAERSNASHDIGFGKDPREPVSQPDGAVLACPCRLPVAAKSVNGDDTVTCQQIAHETAR